jgi:LeuA allosteric (dimerisation) domain
MRLTTKAMSSPGLSSTSISYIMAAEHGFELPRRLQIELSKTVQDITETTGTEITPDQLWATFCEEYLPDRAAIQLLAHTESTTGSDTTISADLLVADNPRAVSGTGNGPIAAFVQALNHDLGVELEVTDFAEHALSAGADAQAAAYVEVGAGRGTTWGVALDWNITTVSLKAIVSALDRLRRVPRPTRNDHRALGVPRRHGAARTGAQLTTQRTVTAPQRVGPKARDRGLHRDRCRVPMSIAPTDECLALLGR